MIGSGSTPFLKGDVVTGKLFIEAKTKAESSKQITIKKEWLEKAKIQSYSTHKQDYALAISFGDGKDYYVIEDRFFEDLYESRGKHEELIDTLTLEVLQVIKDHEGDSRYLQAITLADNILKILGR